MIREVPTCQSVTLHLFITLLLSLRTHACNQFSCFAKREKVLLEEMEACPMLRLPKHR